MKVFHDKSTVAESLLGASDSLLRFRQLQIAVLSIMIRQAERSQSSKGDLRERSADSLGPQYHSDGQVFRFFPRVAASATPSTQPNGEFAGFEKPCHHQPILRLAIRLVPISWVCGPQLQASQLGAGRIHIRPQRHRNERTTNNSHSETG
jgi:hypothetical protein